MIDKLIRFSDHLDSVGLEKEANVIDRLIKNADEMDGGPIILNEDIAGPPISTQEMLEIDEEEGQKDFEERVTYLKELISKGNEVRAGIEARHEERYNFSEMEAEFGEALTKTPWREILDDEYMDLQLELRDGNLSEEEYSSGVAKLQEDLRAVSLGNDAKNMLDQIYNVYLGMGHEGMSDELLKEITEKGEYVAPVTTDLLGQPKMVPIAEASKITRQLIKLSDDLDRKGLTEESDTMDSLIEYFSNLTR